MSERAKESKGKEFQSAAQQACYRRIIPLIQARYDDSVTLSMDEPMCLIREGSATASVYVGTLWGDEAVVIISSVVVSDAKLAPDLLEKLLRENDRMGGLASFSLGAKGQISLSASLMGDCSEKQLILSISEVANMADRYDDIIIEQWGGVRLFE